MERKRVVLYIPGEINEQARIPAYAAGLEITAFMNKHHIPSFVQPIVMQGHGLTLTWDWNDPIAESNPVAQFRPFLCRCGHMKRDHLDGNGGACSVPIAIEEDFVEECPCAGFVPERIKE